MTCTGTALSLTVITNVTRYLGTTVTKGNLIEEEIKVRIAAGNRASFASQKILHSKLISKNTKMKLYKALVRPVVVYGSECWVLTENIKQKLLVFERKILRRNLAQHRRQTESGDSKQMKNWKKQLITKKYSKIYKIQTIELVGACRKKDQ
jgi:hypothetical protein